MPRQVRQRSYEYDQYDYDIPEETDTSPDESDYRSESTSLQKKEVRRRGIRTNEYGEIFEE